MNKNIRRKNNNLSATADMKYKFSIGFKSIFIVGANNFPVGFCRQENNGQVWLLGIFLWVFVDMKRMDILYLVAWNFPEGSPPTGKFHKTLGIKKLMGKLIFPCRFIPDGYSLTGHTQGNCFSIFLSVFCNFLWVCSPSGKFQFPVVYVCI